MILPDIETYIEFIAGYRDKTGKQVAYWPDPKLILASYDVGFVTTVASQTIEQGIAMSHKQAALSERLIEKYGKQLRRHGIEQPTYKIYRLGQREVTHINKVLIVDGMIHFKFPFNERIIADVKTFVKESQGKVRWSKEDKAWIIAITEFNVNWVVSYAYHHKIEVDPAVQEMYNLILETEKTPFSIELCINDNKELYISNAPESLNEYIIKHVGFDNILTLVDMSGALGYKVSKEISDLMTSEYSEGFMKLCADKVIDFVPTKNNNNTLEEIIEWAIRVDRLPICVYNPNFLKPDLTVYQKFFKDDEIQVLGMKETIKDTIILDPKIKLVYTNKILAEWEDRMPLLITYANLLHGVTKKKFLDAAEKVVYYCERLPRR